MGERSACDAFPAEVPREREEDGGRAACRAAFPARAVQGKARDAAMAGGRPPAASDAGGLGLRRPHGNHRPRRCALPHDRAARAPRAVPRHEPVGAFPVPRASGALQRASREMGGDVLTVFLSGGVPGVTPYASGAHIWGRALELYEQNPVTLELQDRTVDEMSGNVAAALDARKTSECHMVGHDLGGLIALDLAAQFPQRIRAVSAIAAVPAAPTGDGVPNLAFAFPPQPLFSRESQRWALERISYSHYHIDGALLDACVAAAKKMQPVDYDGAFVPSLMAAKSRFYATCRDGGYPVPAQVVWGMTDPLASLEHGMWLFRMIAAKQKAAQFHAVNRAGSLPFREEPEAFHQVVASFLEAL